VANERARKGGREYRVAEQGLGLADRLPIDDQNRELTEGVRSLPLGLAEVRAGDAFVLERNAPHLGRTQGPKIRMEKGDGHGWVMDREGEVRVHFNAKGRTTADRQRIEAG
jgi:hypothetical protein